MKKSLNIIRNPTIFDYRGFTIIEALVALSVAGIVFASVAPLLMLAISTRVQTYKAEQAMEIAQGEISRIQVLVSQGVKVSEEVGKLPPAANSGVKVANVAAPTTTVTNLSSLNNTNQALEVDLYNDGNNEPEFLIQIFRDQGMRFNQGSANGQLAVFQVGVRVYSGLAKNNLGHLETQMISLNMTQDFTKQRTRPLAVLYTEVSRSDLKFSLQQYKDYLNQP